MPFDIDDPEDLMALTLAGRREAKALIGPQLLKARQRQDLIVAEAARREGEITGTFYRQQRVLIEALPEAGWMRTSWPLILPLAQPDAMALAREREFKLSEGKTTAFNDSYKAQLLVASKTPFGDVDWGAAITGKRIPKNAAGDLLLHNRAAKAYAAQATQRPLLPPMEPPAQRLLL